MQLQTRSVRTSHYDRRQTAYDCPPTYHVGRYPPAHEYWYGMPCRRRWTYSALSTGRWFCDVQSPSYILHGFRKSRSSHQHRLQTYGTLRHHPYIKNLHPCFHGDDHVNTPTDRWTSGKICVRHSIRHKYIESLKFSHSFTASQAEVVGSIPIIRSISKPCNFNDCKAFYHLKHKNFKPCFLPFLHNIHLPCFPGTYPAGRDLHPHLGSCHFYLFAGHSRTLFQQGYKC